MGDLIRTTLLLALLAAAGFIAAGSAPAAESAAVLAARPGLTALSGCARTLFPPGCAAVCRRSPPSGSAGHALDAAAPRWLARAAPRDPAPPPRVAAP